MNSPASLRKALDHLGALPAIPLIARKILALRINTDEGERALFALIEKDPPILSKIVGLANSPLYGTSRRIMNLHDAAALLGSNRIKMVALSFAMMKSIARRPSGRLDIHGLWQHSLSVAATMDMLARLMPPGRRPAEDEIYLAGLMHDIGFLVLDHLDPVLSDAFHARLAAGSGHTVGEIEAEMLEISHGELGAELGRRWNLPEPIVAVLTHHHDPHAAAGQPLVMLAFFAEKLLPTFGIAEPVETMIADDEWRMLGIDPLKVYEIRARVLEQARDAMARLQAP